MKAENLDEFQAPSHHNFESPIDSNVGNETGEFERIEDKYVVPSFLKEKILERINAYLEPSYLDKETHFTLIDSLYFDSDHLDFFQHHFQSLEARYKLRVRRYAPNGEWSSGPSLLELKEKRNGTTKKIRFMVSPKELELLKAGKTIDLDQELKAINPTIKTGALRKRVDKINELITKFNLRPILSVQYHRLAFEKNGLRVTIDQKLAGEECLHLEQEFMKGLQRTPEIWNKAMNVLNKYSGDGKFVMEIKHQGVIPDWMVGLLKELQIEKTSFSKYCWFIISKIETGDYPHTIHN